MIRMAARIAHEREGEYVAIYRHWLVADAVQRQDVPVLVKALASMIEKRRRVQAELRKAVFQELHAKEVDLLERADLPREPPFHRMIDGSDVVREEGRRLEHVVRESQQVLTREVAVLALPVSNCREPLGKTQLSQLPYFRIFRL